MPIPNTSPTFPATVQVGRVAISTANTNRDGTGTLGTVVTGAANATRIDRIVIQATGTTTAGMVRLFIDDGSVKYLFKEVAVSAIVPSGTTAAFTAEVVRSDGLPVLNLLSTHILKASTHNAETFNILAFGGDY